ncbi:MAG: helix-turn-helix transcriptional regulator [Clostridia bacterium]|nr:helix-turn-helix transcriptional regulator [Clostridia bacterium]
MEIKRLKTLREEHGLRQKDIGKILNISRQLYSRYERGTQRLPIKHLITLSKYYNISIDYILNLSDIKRPIDGNK